MFSRYLKEKCSGHYQVNGHLGLLLDDIIKDSRWDMTYLGMQVMVEGLALAAFSFMHQLTPEPLLKKLLRYVMADEARHVAFGILSLQEVYAQLSAAEIRERQEFAYEAAVRMRDRMAGQEVWDRLGVSPTEAAELAALDPQRKSSSRCCSPRSCRTARSSGSSTRPTAGCVTKFTEMGVIAYENYEDTTARDRPGAPTASPAGCAPICERGSPTGSFAAWVTGGSAAC